MREYLNYLLGVIVWVLAFILVAGCCVEAFLLFRYPGLNDSSSGPAYYWPKDAFQNIGTGGFVLFIFFCIFLMLYQTQKAKTANRSKVPGAEYGE